jgi:hypothetical protein
MPTPPKPRRSVLSADCRAVSRLFPIPENPDSATGRTAAEGSGGRWRGCAVGQRLAAGRLGLAADSQPGVCPARTHHAGDSGGQQIRRDLHPTVCPARTHLFRAGWRTSLIG